MQRTLASIQKVSKLEPIEGADLIEVATILGWKVVVMKGEFKEGDLCVYFEIDSLLPVIPEFEFLAKGNKPKKMLLESGDEVEGYRLKTIRLKGQISQGLALPTSRFTDIKREGYLKEGEDVTDSLNIHKYEPPIPAELAGKVKGQRPHFVPKTDEIRIQAVPHVLEKYTDLRWVVTEKLNGSSVSLYLHEDNFGVCSRKLELVETPENTLWQLAREMEVETKLRELGRDIVLQGEVVGENIQSNRLRIKGRKIFFYNAYDPVKQEYLDYKDFMDLIDSMDLPRVPVVNVNFELPESVDEIVAYATKYESLLGKHLMAEGIVVRPWTETKDKEIGRLSFKVINPEYLLKHDE